MSFSTASPLTNFPGGFAGGLTLRGMPILQTQPGRVFWLYNGTVLEQGEAAGLYLGAHAERDGSGVGDSLPRQHDYGDWSSRRYGHYQPDQRDDGWSRHLHGEYISDRSLHHDHDEH